MVSILNQLDLILSGEEEVKVMIYYVRSPFHRQYIFRPFLHNLRFTSENTFLENVYQWSAVIISDYFLVRLKMFITFVKPF